MTGKDKTRRGALRSFAVYKLKGGPAGGLIEVIGLSGSNPKTKGLSSVCDVLEKSQRGIFRRKLLGDLIQATGICEVQIPFRTGMCLPADVSHAVLPGT